MGDNHNWAYWGHSENDSGNGIPESLETHLRETARLTQQFAAAFNAADQGYITGLTHDVGKYPLQFQKRVRGQGNQPGRDHSSQGAYILARRYCKHGFAPALAVLGHHIGLQPAQISYQNLIKDIHSAMNSSADNFTGTDIRSIMAHMAADGITLADKPPGGITLDGQPNAAKMLDVRMLFSALVDADYLATEAHFEGDAKTPRRPRPDGPILNPAACLDKLESYLGELREKDKAPDSPIARLRRQLSDDCRLAAELPKGIFTLSAPTGSGKTLSMLLFALLHAKKHNLRRIVLVMPFLNIIDQTAGIYRELFSDTKIFSENYILEDHSRADLEDNNEQLTPADNAYHAARTRRLLTENWDAPIILTSNVACLESLMNSRSSRCRKLHRLAKSIILFDEVQTLPQNLAVATLATLSRLTERFDSSVVFATATQPAFGHLHDYVSGYCNAGWQAKEIVRDTKSLFKPASKRVKIHWRHNTHISPQQLAGKLTDIESDQWLCIVNLKRHATSLIEAFGKNGIEGLTHLSTNMCTAHRQQKLEDIRFRLNNHLPCRLVATQCVEAGVDLDFPVVFRAIAPLEAIAQAAGRCNRHGRMSEAGNVYVVNLRDSDSSTQYPPGYGPAMDSTLLFLNALTANTDNPNALDDMDILNNPEKLRCYFQQHYKLSATGSGANMSERDILEAIDALDFPRVASLYKIIKNECINVLTPYDPEIFEQLKSALPQQSGNFEQKPGFWRNWFRRAQPYSVSLYPPAREKSIWNNLEPIYFSPSHTTEQPSTNWFLPTDNVQYDNLTGLKLPEDNENWII